MQYLAPLFKRLAPFFIFFVALEFIVRIALIGYSWSELHSSLLKLVLSFVIGFGYDIVAFIYMAIVITFFGLFIPARKQGQKLDRICGAVLFFAFTYILMFSAVGEWFFWDEFQSRFNFIAVDYLVYTTEVIGNVQESYPVGLLMSIVAAISLALAFGYYKIAPRYLSRAIGLKRRLAGFAAIILVSVVSFNVTSGAMAQISENRTLNEVARNGIYELFSAFLNNELDYNNFYVKRPIDDVKAFVQKELGSHAKDGSPLNHKVVNKAAPKKYNLVIVTVESLSASYLKEFGNTANITPHLDELSNNSLYFTNLYATGTRTVYGLSAITLGIPPIPGNSIVRRAQNENMFSLGSVLNKIGYDTKFIYGGYGYFDNMNEFFGNNGYHIVDRNNLSKEEIHFANVWGVADDDVFRRVIKENDKSYAAKKPFFNMIMTTSNHRPFTFPDGKIDIPSHSGKYGGVKFTDFAINEFLTSAKTKPWFKDTIFVIIADHTASSSGKTELDPSKYRIPMWVYAPGIVKPRRADWLASQLDVPPTILGLMGISYDSRFYGKDLMKEKPERVFISNYQKLGYMTKEGLVILSPGNKYDFYKSSNDTYKKQPNEAIPKDLLEDAIGYYQSAAQWKDWSRDYPQTVVKATGK